MSGSTTLRGELFDLFRTFSKTEVNKFGEYLSSPFFNKSARLLNTFNYIKTFYPQFQNTELTLKNIHQNASNGTAYNELTIRNNLSDLYKLALKFLSVQKFLSNSENGYEYISKELIEREKFNLLEHFVKSLDKFFKKETDWNNEVYLQKFKINSNLVLKDILSGSTKGATQNINKVLETFNDSVTDFNIYYITGFAYIFVLLKSMSEINNISLKNNKIMSLVSSKHFQSLLKESKSHWKNNPLLELSVAAYNAHYYFDNTAKYVEYRNAFDRLSSYLSINEQEVHINFLYSYCAFKINTTGTDDKPSAKENLRYFDNEVLTLTGLKIDKGLFKTEKAQYITPLEFRHMLISSMQIGNIEWAEKLISDHINKLEYKNREPLKTMGLMYINFLRKDYDSAISCANKMNLQSNNYLKFDVYNTRIKIYYERENFESAIDLIRTYKQVIERTDFMPKAVKRRIINFLNIVNLFIMVRMEKKSSDNLFLKEINKKIDYAISRDWLIEKTAEFTKS